MLMYHVNDDGDVKLCHALNGRCPFVIHSEDPRAAERAFGETMAEAPLKSFKKVKKKPLVGEFSGDDFYGTLAPRNIQVEPLNAVAQALEEDDATQLVAACGTGKTYMHRQLLNHAMSQEGANGVGVMLTSSIKLAQDTANDLRPAGGYDGSFGKYGVDYEVIEVHSDARPYQDEEHYRQSVRDKGVISVDRIEEQMRDALAEGKKVVIVSTYDSVSKVQEAQSRFGEEARADLLIHDEAHNILGQQKPTTVADDENVLTAYVGFHDDIPGALKARKRLYSTATPVVQESMAEKDNVGSLEEAQEIAQRMAEGNQRERVTVYSDHEFVGRVSGFISQHDAVADACLAKPHYEIRESTLTGSVGDFSSPVVNPDGTVVERSASTRSHPMTPETYGALNSTLEALIAEPDNSNENASSNVLAYVGSIRQAEGFKESFREAALAKAGGMGLDEAEARVNDPDKGLRDRARARLLAEHAMVKAAHSRTDAEAVRERKEAFEMFRGHAAESHEWTPHKRVLANVDIFSEGVSIPEIDTVVISDDKKLNEKSMTQAIGRAIRVVPNNSHKKVGRVIIPSVVDESGRDLTEASVNMATYTATKVERGSTAKKLRGENLVPDTSTAFKRYGADGRVTEKLAVEYSQNAVTDLGDLATAYEINNAHTNLLSRGDGNYKDLSRSEQLQVQKSYIHERLASLKKDGPRKRYLEQVEQNLQGKSTREIRTMVRNGRVLSSALASGDISSLHAGVAKKLIEHEVITSHSPKSNEPSLAEKKEFLKSHVTEYSFALMTKPPQISEPHEKAREVLRSSLGSDVGKTLPKEIMSLVRGMGGPTENTRRLETGFLNMLEDDEFVETSFKALSGRDYAPPVAIQSAAAKNEITAKVKSFWDGLLSRTTQAATEGSEKYSVDPSAVKKTGELTSRTLIRLLAGDE